MTLLNLSRAAATSLAVAALLLLSACGNPEPAERKAFIEFLQTRIIGKSGVHIPKLSEAEKQKLGQYAPQYEIISKYHEDINGSVIPAMQDVKAVLRLSTPKSVLEGRGKLAEAIVKNKEARNLAEARFAQAKAEYAALSQPDDLKPVFAEAFKRVAADPADVLAKLLAVVDEAMLRNQKLGAFLEANKASITFTGMSVEVTDQKLLDAYNAQIADIQKGAARLAEVQNELRKLIGR